MVDSTIERAVEGLLDAFWTPIAASGWNRYQLHGRGALLASMSMLHGKSNSMDYLTASSQGPLPQWLSAAISSYDPATSVVLVFIEDEVFQRTRRPTGSDLREEHPELLTGSAYFKVVTRLPPPPQCAKESAH